MNDLAFHFSSLLWRTPAPGSLSSGGDFAEDYGRMERPQPGPAGRQALQVFQDERRGVEELGDRVQANPLAASYLMRCMHRHDLKACSTPHASCADWYAISTYTPSRPKFTNHNSLHEYGLPSGRGK